MGNANIKIAWVHNFSNDINNSSGIFMYQLYKSIKSNSNSNIDIELINIGSILNPVNFFIKYFKFKRKFNEFDILHAQYGSGTGFFVSLFSQKKILSLRGSDWYKSPSCTLYEKFHIFLGNLLTRRSIPKYDNVIVMSERMKAELKLRYSDIHVNVISDGLNLNKFYPEKEKENQKFRILFSTINKKSPVKRYQLAENSFKLFNKKYQNSELIFMSGVSHDKVNSFINSCDVILLTSTHEGWPNIIKEGLACNVPFVSTDVSDLKFLANKTRNCFVCDADEVELSKALERVYLLKNTSDDLRKLSKKFEINKTVNKLLMTYDNSN